MTTRSTSHQEAFGNLSMIERTVLDFLEDLGEGADSDLQESINDVEEAVLNG